MHSLPLQQPRPLFISKRPRSVVFFGSGGGAPLIREQADRFLLFSLKNNAFPPPSLLAPWVKTQGAPLA